MYIIAKLDGTLIQKSNQEVDDEELQVFKNRFETSLNVPLLATKDEIIVNNSEQFKFFDVEIVNNQIVNVIEKVNPIVEINLTPSVEDRISALEEAVNFALGL